MCGRFSIATPIEELKDRFRAEPPKIEVKPRYNAAPGQDMLVIPESMPRQMALFRWGLVPAWAKDPRIGNHLINARAETVKEKPAFRHAYRKNRCLVIADGYFEWDKKKENHVPYYFFKKGRQPFAFAGLCEHWKDEKGKGLDTFTIITTAADSLVSKIHSRMPVILPQKEERNWLDPNLKVEEIENILKHPLPAKEMEAYPISTIVNNPRNDISDIIKPA
jgi:putative SOS response-associated peptidase YedK